MSGLSRQSQLKDKLSAVLKKYADEGLYTDAYVECGRFSAPAHTIMCEVSPAGRDIFDVSSLTKALVTTPLIFSHFSTKELFSATVGDYFDPKEYPASVRALPLNQLLSHSSGLPFWRNFWLWSTADYPSCQFLEPSYEADRNRIHKHIQEVFFRVENQIDPSKKFVYSDLGFILLGEILQKITQKRLDVLFLDFLNSLGFSPQEFFGYLPHGPFLNKVVSTGWCSLRQRVLEGSVHDENCSALGGVTGHAGLFASGPSVALFLRRLLDTPLGVRIVAENSALRKAGPADGLLGWRQGNGISASLFGGGKSIGHYGFTGTGFWVTTTDSGLADTYCILLTNRVISGRISNRITDFRKEVHTLFEETLWP